MGCPGPVLLRGHSLLPPSVCRVQKTEPLEIFNHNRRAAVYIYRSEKEARDGTVKDGPGGRPETVGPPTSFKDGLGHRSDSIVSRAWENDHERHRGYGRKR
jgi:hypothetical protein